MIITNKHNLPLPLAVWLLYDEYDYNPDPNYISATSLLKPIRQTVLARRIPVELRTLDVADLLASSYGTALHDSIEKAWRVAGAAMLKKLGIPAKVADTLIINPTPEQLAANPDALTCYMETRTIREIDGYKIGGKFDMILDYRLFDHKSTSVFAYMSGSKDEDYGRQGGIYRWLNPELVKDDHVHINMIFTDWQKSMVAQNPNYPKLRAIEHIVPMPSIAETENWIRERIRLLNTYWDAPEHTLPRCTDAELWRSEPVYKYYSDAAKMNQPGARATKRFDNLADANAMLAAKGKGAVKTVPGEPKACAYCPAFDHCTQKDEYFDVQP